MSKISRNVKDSLVKAQQTQGSHTHHTHAHTHTGILIVHRCEETQLHIFKQVQMHMCLFLAVKVS